MALPTNNNSKGKGNSKNQKGTAGNSKFIVKPQSTKGGGGMPQKPRKTGGTRGS